MTPKEHLNALRQLAERDGRYRLEAYLFVSEAVGQTANWIRSGDLAKDDPGGGRGEHGENDVFHVSGRELLAGIRKLACERWGPLTRVIFDQWGVTRTEDFGEIVFLMVDDENMKWKRRECDRKEDFANGYDFATAFENWD